MGAIPGSQILDPKSQILDPRSQILDLRCQIPGPGSPPGNRVCAASSDKVSSVADDVEDDVLDRCTLKKEPQTSLTKLRRLGGDQELIGSRKVCFKHGSNMTASIEQGEQCSCTEYVKCIYA